MKRILPISLITLFLGMSWFFLSSHSDGVFGVNYSGGPANSGLDRTGGPLSGGNSCGQCHSGGGGSTSIAFELIDSNNVVVTSYIPGASYTVKHQVTSSSIIKGFQSVALLASNAQAGTFTTVLSTQSHISPLAGKQYIEHVGSSSTGLFQFKWTAPAIGSGNVTFYSCGNGVNGNGGTSGDTPGSPISSVISEAPYGTFNYSSTSYCSNGSDPTPTVVGIMGGTFSAPGGGVIINPSTGLIDLSASTPGSHSISYTFSGGVSTKTIKIGQTYSMTNQMTICSTDSVFLQGAWQNTSGTYISNLQTVLGCDSIITTVLSTYAQTGSTAPTQTICQGGSVVIGGITRTTAGVYTHVLTDVHGCDSTITTTLVVNPKYTINTTETICQGDSTFFGGTWYSSNGLYTDSSLTTLGCDSIRTLNLTVTPIDLTIADMGIFLSANQAGATYQWLNCNVGNTPISGATSQTFYPLAYSNYSVVVTFQNCTDTSDCIEWLLWGLYEQTFGEIKVFPNPSKGKLGLSFTQDIHADLKVFDLNGKELFSDFISSSSYAHEFDLSSGTYILRISNDKGASRILWVVE
jgi:hypothetical protein